MSDRSSKLHLARPTDRGNESAILAAALVAFSEKGFNGASMRDISKGAGTSLSNMYNYYPSKSDLLSELLRRANDEQLMRVAHAVAAAGTKPTLQMQEGVRAFVAWVIDFQDAARVALSEIRYLSGAEREQVVAARDHTQAVFERIVADGNASGEFRTPYPEDAARNIVSMCSVISTWYHDSGRLSAGGLAPGHARYALALLEATEVYPVIAPSS